MSRSRLTILVCIAATALLGACSDDDFPTSSQQITGSGNLISETRPVANFSSLAFTTVGDVVIERGPTQSVTVTVDDNILSHISTTAGDGVLLIGSDNNLSEFDLTVEIVVPHLEGLALTGVGNIVCQDQFDEDWVDVSLAGVGSIHLDVTSDLITTRISGVGNVSMAGTVESNIISHGGVGNIDAFGMVSEQVDANVSGIGNVSVNVTDHLKVTISSPATVFYRGTPTILSTITGNGQLVNAN